MVQTGINILPTVVAFGFTYTIFTVGIRFVQANLICPSNPPIAHYPNPLNCAGYIFCVRGIPFPGSCTGNLYWNLRTKRCDERANVDCGNRAPPPSPKPSTAKTTPFPTTSSTSTRKPVPSLPGNSIILPSPNVVTSDSELEINISPVNRPNIYDESSMGQEKSNTTKYNTLPSKFMHKFSCENQPCGIYPNVNDCSSFLVCSGGIQTLKHCNDGQLFDIRSFECQPPKVAQCWEEPTAEPFENIDDLNPNLCSFHNKSENTNLSEEIILNSPSVTSWGDWQDWKYCPENSYVNGIYVWRQLVQLGSVTDQAGVVSLSLNCANVNGDKVVNIESTAPGANDEGWPPHYTCSGTGIGFQMNSKEDQGSGDDLGTDNVNLICSCGPSVRKPYEDQTGPQSGNRGTWTNENICLPKQAVCGMQAQMQAFTKGGNYDNTGLNNLKMKCCNVPSPVKTCQPIETMQLIRKCNNLEGIFHRRCDFQSSVGLLYDYSVNLNVINFYQSIGYGLNVVKQELANTFKDGLGKLTTHYNWASATEKIWNNENKSTKSVYIDVNTTTELYQIIGKCSMYKVKTNVIVKIDKKVGSSSTETTLYEIE